MPSRSVDPKKVAREIAVHCSLIRITEQNIQEVSGPAKIPRPQEETATGGDENVIDRQ